MTTVYTIGHSTREIKDFIKLLKDQSITQLVDIRTIPKSRHNPQYGGDQLKQSLEEVGVKYIYHKTLGVLRPAAKNYVNEAWRNKSFRNYADYVQTNEFKQGLEELIKLSEEKTTAIMCAEAVPWRCHRSLVADALMTRGVTVYEIISDGNMRSHSITSFAVVNGKDVTYPKVE